MSVPLLLLETLDDLTLKDFKRFQWLLENGVLDCCKPVARSRLEDADRPGTVGVMTRDYGEGTAANVAVEILKKMGHNGTAQKLHLWHHWDVQYNL
uniref:Pyrin domain-containing protein n=1 Tax=Cyclopterus lumpus TaxID=8103 RepID=A0A8C2WZ64_CYCLU